MQAMTAEEILAKAADLVERPGGWCQGKYVIGAAVCLRGALMHADGAPLDHDMMCRYWASHAAADAADAIYMELGSVPAVRWNDAPGRTAEEVATVIRNAKRHLVAP